MLACDVASLCCVDCGGALRLAPEMAPDEVVVDGVLTCVACGRAYPVLDTVGIFFRRDALHDFLHPREVAIITEKGWTTCLAGSGASGDNRAQIAVMENWAYQWGELTETWNAADFEGEGYLSAEAFRSFIPVSADGIANRRVLVCAGGLGREAYHLAKARPAKLLVNEIGVEIYKVASLIPDAGRRLILMRSDMTALPLPAGSVDLAICDHALQHVPDHRRAFGRLCAVTAPAGRVAVCVYSHENNWVMTRFIEPLKGVFHSLPLKAQRYVALPFAVAISLLIHGVYGPLSVIAPALASRLPLFAHMMMWRKQPFSLVWMQCFDLIHAPVSHHFRRTEMESLARENALEIMTLTNTNQTLWSLVAAKSRG